jgi:hypothetical protein
MKMEPRFARPVRRAMLTMAMLLGAHAALFAAVEARPELPPVDVDRVEVVTPDGTSYEIRDPAAVARLVAFARERRIGWMRISPTICFVDFSRASFYKGSEPRGWISWNARNLQAPSGDATAMYPLPPHERAELQRLLVREEVGR